MPENKTDEILEEMRVRMYERQMERLLKRVKWARYVLFFLAMAHIIPVLVAVAKYQWEGLVGYEVNTVSSAFFFVVFFLSARWPFEGLLIAAVAYLGLTVYVYATEIRSQAFLYEKSPVDGIVTWEMVIFFLLRLALIFLLVIGASQARKYKRAEHLLNGNE